MNSNNNFEKIISFVREIYGEEIIPLHRPIFDGNEKAYLADCIDSNFVRNEAHGQVTWIQKGSHKVLDYFKEGAKYQSEDFTWYHNSWLKIKQTPYLDSKIHGTQKRWDAKGTLRESIQYQEGQKLGEHLIFDKKGLLIQSRTHLGKDMGLKINPLK